MAKAIIQISDNFTSVMISLDKDDEFIINGAHQKSGAMINCNNSTLNLSIMKEKA